MRKRVIIPQQVAAGKISSRAKTANNDDHWDGGGAWTEIKLDAVMYFVECYTTALTRKKFDLWYVDAFAGSGQRKSIRQEGGLFEGIPLQMVTEWLDGSARRALKIEPPFHHFVFNEKNPERNLALQILKAEHPTRDIRVFDRDANDVLREMFTARPWWPAGGKSRAVVFLDPFALQVEWETLEILARTEAVDVWYLFPIRDVTRQLAWARSGVGPKEGRLDKVLSATWRTDLYAMPAATETSQQGDLFGQSKSIEEERTSDQKQVEQWFKRRLETIFGYASEPLPLLTGDSRQIFSLFLCVANRGEPAIDLAKKFHRYVMKNFGPEASHRTSGH